MLKITLQNNTPTLEINENKQFSVKEIATLIYYLQSGVYGDLLESLIAKQLSKKHIGQLQEYLGAFEYYENLARETDESLNFVELAKEPIVKPGDIIGL